jgi:hypothetical protein
LRWHFILKHAHGVPPDRWKGVATHAISAYKKTFHLRIFPRHRHWFSCSSSHHMVRNFLGSCASGTERAGMAYKGSRSPQSSVPPKGRESVETTRNCYYKPPTTGYQRLTDFDFDCRVVMVLIAWCSKSTRRITGREVIQTAGERALGKYGTSDTTEPAACGYCAKHDDQYVNQTTGNKARKMPLVFKRSVIQLDDSPAPKHNNICRYAALTINR